MNDYNFGNFICFLREQKGLSQAEVASMLSLTPAAVSKWETGASKPRVEILFRLADILGVRPEELMAGRYLPQETLDPDAVRRINERYEYLRKTESYDMGAVKLRRAVAWIIDWNLAGLATLILIGLFTGLHSEVTFTEDVFVLGTVLCMLTYPVGFVLRDLWAGRSLGKKIMGLVILDQQTAAAATRGQRVVRNLFLFIMQFDLVVMLIGGRSIGDRVAQTVVVSAGHLDSARGEVKDTDAINAYRVPPRAEPGNKRRTTWILVAALVLALAVFAVILGVSISAMLGKAKETEEYAAAYAYLIESDAFAESGAAAEDIRLNRYSATSYGGERSQAEFSFSVDGRKMVVVCHKNGDEWYACADCTKFQ